MLSNTGIGIKTQCNNKFINCFAELLTPTQEEGIIYLCKNCNVYSIDFPNLKRHYSEVHNTAHDSAEDVIIPLKPLSRTTSLTASSSSPVLTKRKRGRPRKYPQIKSSFPFAKTGQVAVIGTEELTVVSAVVLEKTDMGNAENTPQRKRGRPRKSATEEERKVVIDRMQGQQGEDEQKKDQLDEQKMECRKCGRMFRKLRQLTSHRCQFDEYEESGELCDSEDEGDGNNLILHSANKVPTNSLDFDTRAISDILDFPQHEIPQTLNEKALPYPGTNKSAGLKFYTCPVCKKVFKTKPNLTLHLGTHTTNKPFKCSKCSYSSMLKTNLQIHMRKHTNERLRCVICSFSCFSKGNLKAHLNNKHGNKPKPVYCDLCQCRMYTNSNLLRHLEAVHDIEMDKRAKSYYEEKKMLSRDGKRNLIYQCHVCRRKFKDKRNHDHHLLLHQRDKPFKCTICPYTSVRSTDLERHVRRHWFIFICHLCQTKFLSLELLKTHLATHEHPVGMSDNDILERSIDVSMFQSDSIELLDECRKTDSSEPGNKIMSPTDFLQDQENDTKENCRTNSGSKAFKRHDSPAVEMSELQELGKMFTALHFKRLTLDLLCEIRAQYGDNECPLCGKLFSFRPHLEVHKKTHQAEKEFKCDVCSYSSHSKQGLKRHVDNVHIAAKHKCPSCSFETTSSHYLQTHLKTHQGSDAFKCTQCSMTTGNEDTMKRHIVSNHPDLPRSELKKIMGKNIHIRSKMGKLASYSCQLCGQVFRRVCDLRRHIWFHKGINPYKCELCKFECRSLSNLKSHMVRHSDAKNHLCDQCGKAFKMKSALTTHRNAQHSVDKQHSCSHCEFTAGKEALVKHHMDTVHLQPQVKTFRCFHCMQYTNSKETLRDHYSQEHPDDVFDETLTYEVPEERITTLNISINHKDGVLQYKCSKCDVLLANNGELGQHLRETHGLAITTSTEVDGEADPEQLHAGNLNSQTDLSSLPQGLQVELIDSMSDKTSAEQLLQELIDIQVSRIWDIL